MYLCRFGVAAAFAVCLSSLAAAQAGNSGFTTAVVVDVAIPDTTSQMNSYNLPGESAVATPEATSSSVANYGATAYSSVSSSVGAETAYATAMQLLNGLTSYAESRGIATIDDLATVTGPEATGTPVTLTLTMIITGTYPDPDPDLAPVFAFAGASLSWADHTNGTQSNGPISGDNAVGHTLSPLVATFNTTVGASIELNYSLDAWVYVAGNSTIGDTETVDLTLGGLYAKGNLPGIALISNTGHPYAVPTPPGFAALGVGLAGLLLRRPTRSRRMIRAAAPPTNP